MCGCAHTCVAECGVKEVDICFCAHTYRGQKLALDVLRCDVIHFCLFGILLLLFVCLFEAGSLIGLELTNLARLTGQRAQEIAPISASPAQIRNMCHNNHLLHGF